MHEVTSNTVLVRCNDLVTRRIAGETLIVPIRGDIADMERLFWLNEVGSRMWSLLDGARTLQQVADLVAEEYEVSAEEACADLLGLAAELHASGLALVREAA